MSKKIRLTRSTRVKNTMVAEFATSFRVGQATCRSSERTSRKNSATRPAALVSGCTTGRVRGGAVRRVAGEPSASI